MTQKESFVVMRETWKKMQLKKSETAQELSISEAGVDRLRAAGKLKSKMVLGQVMFSLDEISRFLTEA